MNGGGPGSAIWKSTDAGQTWAKLENGHARRAARAASAWTSIARIPTCSTPRIEHPTESGVYRIDDAGASWRKMSDTNPRPMYFSQIRIDPQTDSRIYVLGVSLHISDDGGTHVPRRRRRAHPRRSSRDVDQPARSAPHHHRQRRRRQHLARSIGEPGCGCRTCSARRRITSSSTCRRRITCAPACRTTTRGAARARCAPTAAFINDDWYVISGGDGFQPLMDPTDARIVYAESQDGRMSRIDRLTNERTTIRPEPAELKPGEPPPYRFNWDTAMQLSPFDPATIYIGANLVLKSSDRGRSYQPISPDLTTNTDREALSIMGVVGKDVRIAKNDGVGSFGNIVTLEESAARQGVVWVGSDDGVVSVTQDAGKTWTNVTSKISGVPKWTYVSDVLPSRAAAGTAYVAFDGHRGGDYNTYVFATTDYGATWRSIAGNLPKGEVARGLAEDRRNADILYLGTETGLWVSWNRGGAVDAPQGQPADDADLRDQAASARQRPDPRDATRAASGSSTT